MKVLDKSKLALPAFVLPGSAFAQATYDTTSAVADIAAGATAIAAIGAAVLGLFIIRKVWKMVRP